jgi:hypothetical protein
MVSWKKPDLRKIIREHKIDAIIGTDPGINSYQNAPFSLVAQELGIPFFNLFDGVLDYTVSNPNRTFLSKLLLGLSKIASESFRDFTRLYLYNYSLWSMMKYLVYSMTKAKNRYAEHNAVNLINGEQARKMFRRQMRDADVILTGLPPLDSLLSQKKSRKCKKRSVLVISQPLIKDKVLNAKENTFLTNDLKKLALRNPDFSFIFRFHPVDKEEDYKAILNVKNITLQRAGDADLNDAIRDAEYVTGFFSTVMANAIFFEKKLIAMNPFNRLKDSIYLQEKFLASAKSYNEIDFKKIDKFYAKQHPAAFRKFFMDINYWKPGETATGRIEKILKERLS